MKSSTSFFAIGTICLISAVYPTVFPAFAQSSGMIAPSSGATADLSYADLADLADAAPLIANVRIRNIITLKPERAGTPPAGHKRVFVEAEVTALIRGEGGIAPRISYLYDAPLDARGKLPRLKKATVILFARPTPRPGEVQLMSTDAQVPATPAMVERVKALVAAILSPDAPPHITGIGDAFHVAGTVAGEGETQIFLRTQSGDPVSLSILRRPGQAPRWAVALGEIVDESARAPAPGTLLWYRLACSLPAALPAQSVRTLAPVDADAARADYAFVLQSLGACGRTRQTD